jgi:hypothetical protein
LNAPALERQFLFIFIIQFKMKKGPLSINAKKALKTRVFKAFLAFILRGPFFYKNALSLHSKTSCIMTKNLERTKIKAILKTLKEQYPEQFVPAVEEFMDESKATVVVANLEENEELEYFIRKNFDRYAEVFKALA